MNGRRLPIGIPSSSARFGRPMSALRHIQPHGLFFLAYCTLGAPLLLTGAGCSNEAQASPPTQPDEAAESPSDNQAASSIWGQPGPKPSQLQYDPHDSLAPLVASVESAVV